MQSKNNINHNSIVFHAPTVGGKILARFDCPAHKFLFPADKGGTDEEEGEEGEGDDQRIMVLNHSRHYKVSYIYISCQYCRVNPYRIARNFPSPTFSQMAKAKAVAGSPITISL